MPLIVPVLGAASSLMLMAFVPGAALWMALAILLLGWGIVRLRSKQLSAVNTDSLGR